MGAAHRTEAPDQSTGIDRIVERVRGEFLEMPGLRLTGPQVRRLWHLDPATCDVILRRLVATHFLARDASHQYARPSAVRALTMAKAALGARDRVRTRTA